MRKLGESVCVLCVVYPRSWASRGVCCPGSEEGGSVLGWGTHPGLLVTHLGAVCKVGPQ